MEEKIDILSKKRPTVNELKTEVIRLRKELDKSENGLNHYKSMFNSSCDDNKQLRQTVTNLKAANEQSFTKSRELKTINNILEADNKNLSELYSTYKTDYDMLNAAYKELKAKKQYNATGFVIASLIALAAVTVVILRLV